MPARFPSLPSTSCPLPATPLAERPVPTGLHPPAIDEYHGTLVVDPYRWLEDVQAPDVRAWIAWQNQRTDAYFAERADLERLRQDLTAHWNMPRYGVPVRRADRLFFSLNDGLQPHVVLYWQQGWHGEPQVLFDPNTISEDGSLALGSAFFNREGTVMVYGLSQRGSDWQTLHVRRIDDGADFADVLHWTRQSQVAWHPDSSGFYYNRYLTPGTVPPEEESARHLRETGSSAKLMKNVCSFS